MSRFLETFPSQLPVQAIGAEYGGGLQAKLEGSGDLLGGHVDVALAYPDQRHRSMYGDEQEYGLRYVRDGLTLNLGDQIYTLTPLTQAGRYGFGAGGKMRAGRFTFGGFYQRSRFYFPPETQRAASLAYQMNRFATFSANYLNQHSFFEDDYTVTLRSVLTPTATTTLDAECSIAGRSGAKNNACMLQLSGEQSWISYTAHYIHAGSEYPGYHRNLDSKSASVMLRPLGWLRLARIIHKRNFEGERDR